MLVFEGGAKLVLIFLLAAAPIDCGSHVKNREIKTTPTIASNTNRETEREMENIDNKNMPKLEFRLEQKDSSLQVEYKVKNTTKETIYLFNVLLDMNAAEAVSPEPVYSCLRDNGTLVIAKRIVPLPAIASVELRDIPYVTKIESGKEYSETLNVPIPLDEYNPYFPKLPNSETEVLASESAIFQLQFIRQSDKLKVDETKIAGAYKVWHPNLFASAELLESQPRPLAVKVNRRTDSFERF